MTTVDIDRIAAGGSGVGRLPNGKTVFVPRTAPGDRVHVEVTNEKARWAHARAVEYETLGSRRTEPPCVHYMRDGCGGCQIQHLHDDAQRAAKSQLIGEALRRIGKREVEDPLVRQAPAPWRYRTKITLAVDPATGVIGLHRLDTPALLFEPDDCLITREPVMTLWRRVRQAREMLPRDLVQLILREDREGRVHAIVVSPGPWNAAPLAGAVGDANLSIWWKPARGAARVVAGPETGFPATAFEQSSSELATEIRTRAGEFLRPTIEGVAWDLYGGVGDTARLLADFGARVWTVDADRRAHGWGKNVTRGSSAGSIQFVTERVEDAIRSLPPAQNLVLNPPRTGVVERVTEAIDRLAREGARRMAYISCDPATLARDLRRLPSWEVVGLEGYDLFPQTSHVETLVLLEAG
jgi:23S rRNA (uracil1939-C5)-methyltransferase